jgi:16S rRNA (cytosine1402-N4)-methyltransferase
MCKEVLAYLDLKSKGIVVDATIGTGGHSLEILKHLDAGSRLIGIDKDADSLEVCRERLKDYQTLTKILQGDFRNIDKLLESEGIRKVDAILFDLGVSSFQLDDPKRGFSFRLEGPLDMRMDRNSFISAYDLINNLNEHELSSLLWLFGEERWHNRIAHHLIEQRRRYPITTTTQLAGIVLESIPHYGRHYRIHPATRTFQAFRIAVNRELEALQEALQKSLNLLNKGGRICVISFHSLEERVVKLKFREAAGKGRIKLITKKPIRPSLEEIKTNPRSRSARLRAAQKL